MRCHWHILTLQNPQENITVGSQIGWQFRFILHVLLLLVFRYELEGKLEYGSTTAK